MLGPIFFFGIMIVGILTSRLLYGRYATTMGFYSVLWGVALIGYYSNPLGYFEASSFSTFMFVVSFSAFLAGSCIPGLLNFHARKRKHSEVLGNKASVHSGVIPKRSGPRLIRGRPAESYVIAVTLLGLFVTCVYLGMSIRHYSWETFISEAYRIRAEYVMSENLVMSRRALEYAYWFGIPVFYCSGILNAGILMTGGTRRFYSFIPILSALLYDFATKGRGHTLNMLIFYGVALVWLSHRKNTAGFARGIPRKKMIGTAIIAVTVFAVAFSVMLSIGKSRNPGWDVNSHVWAYGKYEIPIVVAHSFNYLIGPLPSLNVVLNREGPHKLEFGRNTFYPIERIFVRYLGVTGFESGPISKEEYQRPVPNGYSELHNTYSYLRYLWDDWGIAGVLLGPFLLAFGASWFYVKTLKNSSVVAACFALIFANVVIQSPSLMNFTNHYILWTIPLFLVAFVNPARLVAGKE